VHHVQMSADYVCQLRCMF